MKIYDTDLNGFGDCPRRGMAKILQRDTLSDIELRDLGTISPGGLISIGLSAAFKSIINGGLMTIAEVQNKGIESINKKVENKTIRFKSGIKSYEDVILHFRRLIDQRAEDLAQIIEAGSEIAIPRFTNNDQLECNVDLVTDSGTAMIYSCGEREPVLPWAQAGAIFDEIPDVNRVELRFQKILTLKKDLEPIRVFEIAPRLALNAYRIIMNYIDEADQAMLLENPNSNMCSENYCPAFGTDFCNCTGGEA